MTPQRKGLSRIRSTASLAAPRVLPLTRRPLLEEIVGSDVDVHTMQLLMLTARMMEVRAVTWVLSILSQHPPQRTRMTSRVRRVRPRRGVDS